MVKELKVYFHVRKSHFNKLTVEELRKVVKRFGVKTRMRKQEMIDFLIESGQRTIVLMSKDLTLERMYQLKEMSGWKKDYGKDFGMGFVTLHYHIEDFEKEFPYIELIPFDYTHKECEILQEMVMNGEIDVDYWKRHEDESVEVFDKVNTEFQRYSFYYDYSRYEDVDNFDDLMIPTKTCKYQIGYLKERQMLGMVM